MLVTIVFGTILTVGASMLLQFLSTKSVGKALQVLPVGGVLNFLFNAAMVYIFTPAMTGPLGGYQWIWLTLLINAVVSAAMYAATSESGNDESSSSFLLSAIGNGVLLVAIALISILIVMGTTWGDGNAKGLASYVHITISDKSYPETDPAHIVIVPVEVARFKGGQVVSGGNNLGSLYHPSDYNLMSVAGELYWVAPLVYNNWFTNLGNQELAGIVAVSAEDPNAEAKLILDHKLHYIPEALFNQDLVRYLYMHGYSGYRLIDPTLEVDDDWVPYYTVDLSTYVTGISGIKVEKMLVVNSDTGKIEEYALDKIPNWVDRIIPGEAAQEYVEWWGLWHDAPWLNFSGQGAQKPADTEPDIAYSRADQSPVWQFPMTSNSSSDNSGTGIILLDTKSNEATLYPINGIAIGNDVRHAFESNPGNIQHYAVKHVILHNIYGELTWVATFISEGENGKGSFQAVGLLSAKTVQGADVIMASSIEEALRDYQRWIANHGSNAVNPTDVNNLKTIDGYVDRIAADTQGGNTVYYITVKDAGGVVFDRIFWGTSTVSQKLPLTKEGDHVAIQYQDVNDRVVAMVIFNNLNVDVPLINPTNGAPFAQPTDPPTATPTPVPPTATISPLFEATPSP